MHTEKKHQGLERIRRLAREHHLGKINVNDIDNWVKNFDEKSILPYILLNTLVIINDDQIKACVEYLYRSIQARFYRENMDKDETELVDGFGDYLKETAFVCATRSGDSASSAAQIMHELREYLGSGYQEYHESELCSAIEKRLIKRVYIVDDFVGTGRQMMDFLTGERSSIKCIKKEKNTCCFDCLIRRYNQIDYCIFSIILCAAGQQEIVHHYPRMTFGYAYHLGDEYDLLKEECVFYNEILTGESRKELITDCIHEIQEICACYCMESPYSLHLSCGFEKTFPNNALELFWWNKHKNWKPLLTRPEDRKPLI